MSTTRSTVRDVVVLRWNAQAPSGRRAEQIAAFLGAEATVIALGSERTVPRCTCLIADVETLAKAADAMPAGAEGLRGLTVDVAAHVFVYGCLATSRHEAVLRALSAGSVTAIRPLSNPGSAFRVTNGQRECCGQFSGLSVGQVDSKREHRFECNDPGLVTTMIAAGDEPFYIRVQHASSQVFFVACDELADIDE